MYRRMMTSWNPLVALLTTLLCITVVASSSIPNTKSDQSSIATETCESRSINYITALPYFESVCYRSKRKDTIASATATAPSDGSESSGLIERMTSTVDSVVAAEAPKPSFTTDEVTSTIASTRQAAPATTSITESIATHETDDVFSDASFLSFEDWKKQILEKSKDAADGTKDAERRRKPSEGRLESPDLLSDDHEIDIDFGAFLGDRRDNKTQPTKEVVKQTNQQSQDEGHNMDQLAKSRHKSKDAGKTCKERTNFASFDSGAQVMKANPEAKSTSAVLSENRDAYMLNTCSAKNKFLIVELSDSILVETIALANFEFFSSTFRHFIVSVSDRYPVKPDRWVNLGTFEAKNSREIQAFLIEDPRVWARYLRIEFLSQYGSEFYCPISLVRVHGRTMIQDILSAEQAVGADDEDETEQGSAAEGEGLKMDGVEDIVTTDEKVTDGLKDAQAALQNLVKTAESITSNISSEGLYPGRILEVQYLLENASQGVLTSAWSWHKQSEDLFRPDLHATCHKSQTPKPIALTSEILTSTISATPSTEERALTHSENRLAPNTTVTPTSTTPTRLSASDHTVSSMASHTITPAPPIEERVQVSQMSSEQAVSPSASSIATISISATSNKTTSAQGSQPTTQESFFKNVSKRLHSLEQNSTLSLKYIEEQSRSLREAFNKVEKRQLLKTTDFLENLNATVLAELVRFSEQYDQIWQSTVFELESQKDLLRRETAAMSSRLKLLADELVFQKRMAIGQSILLLLCLCLVLFSRLLPGGSIIPYPTLEKSGGRASQGSDTTQSSPRQQRSNTTSPGRRPWIGTHQRSSDSRHSMHLQNRSNSPPTPCSNLSGAEDEYTEYNPYDTQQTHASKRNILDDLPSPPNSQDKRRPEDSDLSYIKLQMEDAVRSELVPVFTGAPRFNSSGIAIVSSSPPREPPMRSRGDSTGQYSGDASQHYASRHASQSQSELPVARNENGHLRRSSAASQGEPEMPRRFSIARKPLPALPTEN